MTKYVKILTSGTTWTVPSNWSVVNTIECIGAGGVGINPNNGTNGWGGGGGAYSRVDSLNLKPGSTLYYQIGVTGNQFNSSTPTWVNKLSNTVPTSTAQGCLATSGQRAGSYAVGLGGQAIYCIGDVAYSGGNGGAGASGGFGSAGGGGAAGPNGAGGNGGNRAGTHGSGGGGADGGSDGSSSTSNRAGNGGNSTLGLGGAGATVTTPSTSGTNGGGGGGAWYIQNSASSGSAGLNFIDTFTGAQAGPGGGGGGGGYSGDAAGSGGLYGGGGGGPGSPINAVGGGGGLIVITWWTLDKVISFKGPGTYTFTVPETNGNAIVVNVWGGGGGGADNYNQTVEQYNYIQGAGYDGGTSSFGSYQTSTGGLGGWSTASANGGNGVGGDTNQSGTAGTRNTSTTNGYSLGGAAGGASFGGGSSTYVYVKNYKGDLIDINGIAGKNFGGGGSGSMQSTKVLNYVQSGGGGGGFSRRTYAYGTLPVGSTVSITVGSGGAGGRAWGSSYTSGNGASGAVIISWEYSPQSIQTPPLEISMADIANVFPGQPAFNYDVTADTPWDIGSYYAKTFSTDTSARVLTNGYGIQTNLGGNNYSQKIPSSGQISFYDFRETFQILTRRSPVTFTAPTPPPSGMYAQNDRIIFTNENFPGWTGTPQTFDFYNARIIKIECWGAFSSTFRGPIFMRGGYSVGTYVKGAKNSLYVYVGGVGAQTNGGGYVSGGWNGGGASYQYGWLTASGGGATDVRTSYISSVPLQLNNALDPYWTAPSTIASLNSRIIVAGGGGGSAWYSADGKVYYGYGGNGGGLSGQDGNLYSTLYGTPGGGGSQSAGGAGGVWGSSLTGSAGGLGYGGNASGYNPVASGSAGGGGGGYYGGGAGFPGGGGSGYIGGVFSGFDVTAATYQYGQAGYIENPNSVGNGMCIITILG